LVPAFDGDDDLIGIGGPHERFGIVVGLGNEALDGGMEIDERSKGAVVPRFSRRLVSLAKKPSTALSQEADFGV
jgi:hypothetical protein